MLQIPAHDCCRKRFEVEQLIREQFQKWNYLEVRTPLFVKSPGLEPHIRPFEIKARDSKHPVFLPTSPEFAMKKLLARGLPRIFQMCSAFRDEPESNEHQPEFSMLEFYETDCTLEAFQTRVEELFGSVALSLQSSHSIRFRENQIDLKSPWPRYTVHSLFEKWVGIDLRLHQSQTSLAKVCNDRGLSADAAEDWNDLYFKLWLNLIEPKLPKDRACFVTHYPVSQSSLCNRVKDETGFEWASRFEIYVGQLELGNAFDELRDARVQRENFEKDQETRAAIYNDTYPQSPIDEDLLNAIEKMKPTCGIAIGLDRMCMLLLNAEKIQDVIPILPYFNRS